MIVILFTLVNRDSVIIVYKINWFQQQVQNFGEPFFLVIHEGETLAEVKVRIQKKLQVPDEEFSKVFFFPSCPCSYVLLPPKTMGYIICYNIIILLFTMESFFKDRLYFFQ